MWCLDLSKFIFDVSQNTMMFPKSLGCNKHVFSSKHRWRVSRKARHTQTKERGSETVRESQFCWRIIGADIKMQDALPSSAIVQWESVLLRALVGQTSSASKHSCLSLGVCNVRSESGRATETRSNRRDPHVKRNYLSPSGSFYRICELQTLLNKVL